jgi:hypothetical protein
MSIIRSLAMLGTEMNWYAEMILPHLPPGIEWSQWAASGRQILKLRIKAASQFSRTIEPIK